jgi:hypothetical protein
MTYREERGERKETQKTFLGALCELRGKKYFH